MRNAIKYGAWIAIPLIIGGIIGWYGGMYYVRLQPSKSFQVRQFSSPNGFTNPLLYTDGTEPAADLRGLRNTLENYINKSVNDNVADSISVYFRDLNTGRWTGVNENEQYKPSSMLKVMVMMVYYEQADKDSTILKKKLWYERKSIVVQNYKPEHALSNGYYTIQELIDQMIVYSDNDAADVLIANNPNGYLDLFSMLRLPYPKDKTVIDFMSPQSYAILFRTLYSGTYLSHGLSEKTLELLTKTVFASGIVKGVPPGVTVAHKFGEHTEQYNDKVFLWKELHDCGIVYYPNHPYLLCVMTKGKDFNNLESVISTISQKAYSSIPI